MERMVLKRIKKLEDDNRKKLGGRKDSLTSMSDVSDTK